MSGAVIAEVVLGKRGVAYDLAAVVVLAVEGAQRVKLGALQAVVAHLVGMVKDELPHAGAIRRAAGTVAHRVDAQRQRLAGEAQPLEVLHEHDDDLGVKRRVGGAQHLGAHLVELAQATLLRTLAAEHRLAVPQLDGGTALRHEVVLHRSTHHARRALGPHGHALARLEVRLGATLHHVGQQGARKHAEHLLAHHVGGLADAVHEGVHLLDGRRLDLVEAVGAKQGARLVQHVLPAAHVAAEQVFRALYLLCHGTLLDMRTPGGAIGLCEVA